MHTQSVPLGNSRIHAPGQKVHSQLSGARPPADQRLEATLVLRSKTSHAERTRAVHAMAGQFPHERQYLSAEQYAEHYGASSADRDAVVACVRSRGLHVLESALALGSVRISGSLRDFEAFFQVEFASYRAGDCNFRSYEGEVHIPSELDGIVEGVLGLDNRALTRHHHYFARPTGAAQVDPRHVARLYQFPESESLQGQCIAIIENGGGFHKADLEQYFEEHHIPVPKITVVHVDGAPNAPASNELIGRGIDQLVTDPGQRAEVMWTIETTLDLQLAAAFAPGAHLVVYFCDGTEHGQYHALLAALTDQEHRPSVISCSWGTRESDVSRPFVNAMTPVFEAAALLGVSICVSTGDKFAQEEIAFPSSSPYVLACGGTHLGASGELETVWNEEFAQNHMATVGGVSALFHEPAWQRGAGVARKTGKYGRGVPDVAGKADLAGGYSMTVGGRNIAMGGTSAAAPLWAALVAVVNAHNGVRSGWINPLLYRSSFREATRETTHGTNGIYHAGEGWNACTGWGSPKGAKLAAALSGAAHKAASST